MSLAHARPRVLAVDDEAAIRDVLRESLAEFGYDVEVAGTAIAHRQDQG